MGRRSQHTPDELRELILSATRNIVEKQGFKALSAREIAREIGYAPGTLYNMFRNLDEILLRVEARILAELDTHIAAALAGRKGVEAVLGLAQAYVDFAYANSKMWELIQFHQPTIETSAPDWYLDSLFAPMNRLEPLLSTIFDTSDADESARDARHLWSIIHAVVNTALTPKLGLLSKPTTSSMIENVVTELVASKTTRRVRGREVPVRATNGIKRDRHLS